MRVSIPPILPSHANRNTRGFNKMGNSSPPSRPDSHGLWGHQWSLMLLDAVAGIWVPHSSVGFRRIHGGFEFPGTILTVCNTIAIGHASIDMKLADSLYCSCFRVLTKTIHMHCNRASRNLRHFDEETVRVSTRINDKLIYTARITRVHECTIR